MSRRRTATTVTVILGAVVVCVAGLIVVAIVAVATLKAHQRAARIHMMAVMACRPRESFDRRPGESDEAFLVRIARETPSGGAATMSPATRECVASTERALQGP